MTVQALAQSLPIAPKRRYVSLFLCSLLQRYELFFMKVILIKKIFFSITFLTLRV